MPARIVVGAQWGDEGKAKIVDYLTRDADYVVRYQGGANAGHTVVVDGQKFVFHQIPAGIIHPDKICVIGNAVVVDPPALLKEIGELEARGISIEGRLYVSQNAHLVMPYHKLLDKASEESKGAAKIGTTISGIGPCYRDKAARCGIRIVDLLDPDLFRKKLSENIKEKNQILKVIYGYEELDEEKIAEEYLAFDKRIDPYVTDISVLLNNALDQDKRILFEGAQGTLLDMDHGTYPFVTSSSTIAGGACIGTGIGPTRINEVIGVVKAYTTRVGMGPFPTEFDPEFAEKIRQIGAEFGATTGRPRRCGWFDSVVARFSVRVNGLSSLAVTKLDVLDSIPVIKICTSYNSKGKVIKNFPSDSRILNECEPIYEDWAGWMTPTRGIRHFEDLPEKARAYLERISQLAGAKISIVSVGSERGETVVV